MVHYNSSIRDLEWLQKHGRCMDNIRDGVSQIPHAGRGAFARRFISKGISKKKRRASRIEPRVRPRKSINSSRKRWRDHHVAVNKVMEKSSFSNTTGTILAAQMTAPDQSLRFVSHFLSEMTSDSIPLNLRTRFSRLLSSNLSLPSELDTWFLRGDATAVSVIMKFLFSSRGMCFLDFLYFNLPFLRFDNQLGVTKSRFEGDVLHETLVARCLWESHWREVCD